MSRDDKFGLILLIISCLGIGAYILGVKAEFKSTIKEQQETIDSLNVQVENYKLLYELGE